FFRRCRASSCQTGCSRHGADEGYPFGACADGRWVPAFYTGVSPAPEVSSMSAATMNRASERVRRLGWLRYPAVFADLPSPQALPADVDFLAEFVGPGWLRLSSGPSLKLTALAGW